MDELGCSRRRIAVGRAVTEVDADVSDAVVIAAACSIVNVLNAYLLDILNNERSLRRCVDIERRSLLRCYHAVRAASLHLIGNSAGSINAVVGKDVLAVLFSLSLERAYLLPRACIRLLVYIVAERELILVSLPCEGDMVLELFSLYLSDNSFRVVNSICNFLVFGNETCRIDSRNSYLNGLACESLLRESSLSDLVVIVDVLYLSECLVLRLFIKAVLHEH